MQGCVGLALPLQQSYEHDGGAGSGVKDVNFFFLVASQSLWDLSSQTKD